MFNISTDIEFVTSENVLFRDTYSIVGLLEILSGRCAPHPLPIGPFFSQPASKIPRHLLFQNLKQPTRRAKQIGTLHCTYLPLLHGENVLSAFY